jgi:hypothetical protein
MRRRPFMVLACGLAVAASAALAPPAAFAVVPEGGDMPVTMAIVGDVMLADGPGRSVARGRDPLAPFRSILDQADIRVANLECVIASRGVAEDKPFTFLAHPRTMAVVQRHFDAVSVANNHSGDFGTAAFAEMLERLGKANVGVFGGGRNLAAAHAPLIVERKGLRIALLGYNEFFPRSFEADTDRPGVAWSEDEQVRRDIRLAREVHGADLVIPFMHWGIEHEPLADARQRALARVMIDAGADAVIGGHPHVTQDVESYRGKPIVYSLGNFVFDGFTDVDNNTGWLLRLELDRNGVRSWTTVIARIDASGTPHPRADLPAQCWDRELAEARACMAQTAE